MASPRSSSDRLTSREVEQEFEGICELQLGQVLWLCEYLLLNKCSSAVTPDPTILLEALYQRCWGRDWKSEAESLLDAGSRSVVDDTMALLSAFLYEHILIRKHEDGTASPNTSCDCTADINFRPCRRDGCRTRSTRSSLW